PARPCCDHLSVSSFAPCQASSPQPPLTSDRRFLSPISTVAICFEFDRDGRRNAAAGGERGSELHPAGLDDRDQVAENPVGGVLVEHPLVAELLQVKL